MKLDAAIFNFVTTIKQSLGNNLCSLNWTLLSFSNNIFQSNEALLFNKLTKKNKHFPEEMKGFYPPCNDKGREMAD